MNFLEVYMNPTASVEKNMPETPPTELERLRAENAHLRSELADLEMLYETTMEHGETIENELAEKNIALEQIQARLQEELDQALRYVMSLLPEPMTGPIRAEWLFIPSSELGGDSFGYHWIDAEHLAIYLLDVCGHGVGASLLSVTAISTLRGETLSGIDFRSPHQVLTSMNTVFDISKQNEMFLTLWYGVYHITSHQLTFAAGGHNPAVMIPHSATQTSIILKFLRTQPIIGMIPEFTYRDQTITIPEGSRLFVFSDGVYELQKEAGGMFSFNELCQLLERYGPNNHFGMPELVNDLRAVQGRDAFNDDFSMIILDF